MLSKNIHKTTAYIIINRLSLFLAKILSLSTLHHICWINFVWLPF